jgi:signal transduction histidine kinase
MDFGRNSIRLAVMCQPRPIGFCRRRILVMRAGIVLCVLFAATLPAPGKILWSHAGSVLASMNGAGEDILHGAIPPQDSNSISTLYFRLRIDPLADSAIKSIGEFEAGLVFVEKGQEHLGIGNSRGAWAYCAMNVPKNKKGYEDFNSATPDPGKTWEYIRAGVPKYIAFKIEYVAGQDARVTVWLNPDLSAGSTEMSQPTNITTRFETTATFDEIHLVHRGEGPGWKFSEMVAGTSFDDLLLVPFWQRGWFVAVAGGGLLIGVAGVIQLLERRRTGRRIQQLEKEQAVAAERARIARDIHDELGASLTIICKLAETVSQDHGPAGTGAIPKTIADTARATIQTMDEIVWAVNPKNDTLSEMADYLVYFAEDFLRPAGITCQLEVPLKLPPTPVAAEVRHNLFMAVKEALNNVVKHAGAREVRFGLELAGHRLTVEIADDGRGFRAEEAQGAGNGLDNMRRRMSAIRGETILHSQPGEGTSVKLQVPLSESKTLAYEPIA